MTQYEMTEKLSAKCNVSLAEAKAALEAGDWNTLTATHLLEQERFRRMQALNEAAGAAVAVQEAPEEEAASTEEIAAAVVSEGPAVEEAPRAKAKARRKNGGMKNLGEHIRRLVGWANRNRLVVRREGVTALDLPVSVAALLMLFAPWVCVPLLVIGLLAGCRYGFVGAESGAVN